MKNSPSDLSSANIFIYVCYIMLQTFEKVIKILLNMADLK